MQRINKREYNELQSAELDQLPALLDERTTAKIAGVSLAFLRKGRSEGRIGNRTPTPPFVRVGVKRIKYRTSDVQAWIEGLKTQVTI